MSGKWFAPKDWRHLGSEKEVFEGVQHICADAIALDPETRQHVRDAYDRGGSFNSRASAASKKAAAGAGAAAVAGSGKDDSRKRKRQGGNDKKRPTGQYANYEDFQVNLNRVKPHWILAVDRGEAEKALTVTITLHESSEKRLKNDIVRFWLRKVHRSATDVITAAVMDGYSRLLSRRYVSSAPTTHSPMPLLPSHGHSLSIPPCCDSLKHRRHVSSTHFRSPTSVYSPALGFHTPSGPSIARSLLQPHPPPHSHLIYSLTATVDRTARCRFESADGNSHAPPTQPRPKFLDGTSERCS